MSENGGDVSAIEADVARLLGVPVQLAGTVASGRNSRVYRAETARGNLVAVKQFHRSHTATRDYLQVEHAALQFLWDQGERRVPEPIAIDLPAGLLISEFVEGQRVPSAAVSDADIDEAVDFLVSLKALTRMPGSMSLPKASEACFTAQAVVENIGHRRQRLEQEGDLRVLSGALGAFLVDEFDPTLQDTVDSSRHCLARAGAVPVDEKLPVDLRTLSPSDFGFHNSLRRVDGSLVFIDFEHFGWDDPAKMIADVILHPAMALPVALADRFVAGMLQCFSDDENIAARLQALEPLFGLKWCTILLNEFIAGDMARRRFSERGESDRDILLQAQICKAQNMLHHVQAAVRRLATP